MITLPLPIPNTTKRTKKIERRQKKKLKLHPYCGDVHVVILCILFNLKN